MPATEETPVEVDDVEEVTEGMTQLKNIFIGIGKHFC